MIAANADVIRVAAWLMLFRTRGLAELVVTADTWRRSWLALVASLPYTLLWTACVHKVNGLPSPDLIDLALDAAIWGLGWVLALAVLLIGGVALGQRDRLQTMLTVAGWVMLWSCLTRTPIVLAAVFEVASVDTVHTLLWLWMGYMLAVNAFAARHVLGVPRLGGIAIALAMLLSTLLMHRAIGALGG